MAATTPEVGAETVPSAPVRLTAVRRLRVLVRRVLSASLVLVPGPVVTALHDRWIRPDGHRCHQWRAAATLLFYRPVPHGVITVPGGSGERLVVAGTRLERTLWWYGEDGYEDGEVTAWRGLCARADDVLEIGANIGYYSVVGARATPGRYTAVEPNPEAAAIVRRNLELNGLDRAEVRQAAAVGRGAPDDLQLALPDQEAHSVAPTGSFLREGTECVVDRAATRSITVPTVHAATLFAGKDLVKLDVEGSEAAVLDAARDEIRRARPVILLEFLSGSRRLRTVLSDLIDTDGYRMYDPGPARRRIAADELPTRGFRDLLLVPEERDGVA